MHSGLLIALLLDQEGDQVALQRSLGVLWGLRLRAVRRAGFHRNRRGHGYTRAGQPKTLPTRGSVSPQGAGIALEVSARRAGLVGGQHRLSRSGDEARFSSRDLKAVPLCPGAVASSDRDSPPLYPPPGGLQRYPRLRGALQEPRGRRRLAGAPGRRPSNEASISARPSPLTFRVGGF